ncbi:hypothetical protein FV242_05835 [Methylobacterium sp. WL64]|uniref:hypothetical protein n=1 Tax=Methylobacterium sp. WL64 TaxID=2603894 RepID=UPI0011C6F8ED|nr:hypothetical protein [Methylobacterium sp. WL64]TXN04873.1 hypothetical protein FV242_05835 [Methylobacterium sp. WL64]
MVAPSSKAISHQLANAEVEYQSVLRFSGRRANANVVGISAAALDFDYYKAGLPHRDASAEDVAGMLIEAYEAAGIPIQSLVQDSGRGCYAPWLFDVQMSGDALPRWRMAMKGLRGPKLDDDGNIVRRRPRRDRKGNLIEVKVEPAVEEFETRMLPVWRLQKALGVDRGAIDPARVLRVMGAVHPVSGRMSRLAWPSAIQDIERVSFDAWCDALMPYTRAQVQTMRAERAAWKTENPDHVPAVRRPRRFYGGKWVMIGADLDRLLEHRGAEWFAVNKCRDWWVLFRAIAIAMTEGGTAEEWAERLAPRIGLPVAEVATSLSGVERGLRAHEAGETSPWKGVERSAFYDYAYETIVDRLDIGIEEAGDADLRVLVPGGAAPMSDAERQRLSRAARGVYKDSRPAQVDERLAVGLLGLSMREDGHTIAQVAYVTGRGRTSVIEAMREAQAHLSQASSVPSAPAAEVQQTVREPSRPIVVLDPIEAPAAVSQPASEAPAVPAGQVRVTAATPFHATIETATATWWWSWVDEGRRGRGFVDLCDLRSGTPSDGDWALVEAARQDLTRTGSDALTRSRRRPGRPVAETAPVARRTIARAVPLPPLDLQREVELYREASGGGGLRHRRALVAA